MNNEFMNWLIDITNSNLEIAICICLALILFGIACGFVFEVLDQ